MKNTPTKIPFRRGVGISTAAAVLCLGAVVATAQPASSPASPGPTSRPDTPATTDTPGGTGATGSDMNSMSSSTTTGTLKHNDQRFLTKAAESNQKEEAISELALQKAQSPQVRSFAQQMIAQHQQLDRELTHLAAVKGVAVSGLSSATNSATATNSNPGMGNETGTGAAGTPGYGATVTPGANPTTSSTGATGATASNNTTGMARTGRVAEMGVQSDRQYRSLAQKSGADFDKAYIDLVVSAHQDAVKLYERAAKHASDNDVKRFASDHVQAMQAHLDQANTLTKSISE